MAIDRNIIEWSNTDKAFKAKSYIEIFNMLLENYRAIYGSNIDLTVETAFGEELRMQAEQLYDFAKLAEDVYYTLDINNAHGAILDNLVAFTSNLIRKTNVKSILTAELQIGDAAGTGDIDLSGGTTIYIQDEYNILWNVEPVDSEVTTLQVGATVGTAPKNQVRLTSASYGENKITANLVQLLKNGSYHSNDLILGTIIYEQIGSIEETDEMLRQRKNNTLSYNSKTLNDSIRDYILKNIYSIKDVVVYNANGRKSGNTDTDVNQNLVLPLTLNNGNVVPDFTVPKHDLFIMVQPQTGISEQADPLSSFRNNSDDTDPTELSTAIAKVLKDKITPGIATTNALVENDGADNLVAVADDNGYIEVTLPETVGTATYYERYSFFVANRYAPKITINLLTKNNYASATTQQRIREAIYELSTNYIINQDISLDDLLYVVKTANLDLRNPTFTITGVQIEDGAASHLVSNNSYWLVDKNSESDVGLADWNIVINES